MKTTEVLKVDARRPNLDLIRRAAVVLQSGGLVAFPTETVYGLGANALDTDAVRGIFAAKERPAYDPLIVHIAALKDLPRLVREMPQRALGLVERFWPGPLTLVLPRSSLVPDIVTAGGDTVAIRSPSHPVARALIRTAQLPVAAPSANRFGRLSPTRAEDVLADLEGRVDLILDGGPTPVGVESTVLSLATETPTILRPGGVSREDLEHVLGTVHIAARSVQPEEEIITSPGSLPQHYAPQARLILYRGAEDAMLRTMRARALHLAGEGGRVGLLLAEEDRRFFTDSRLVLQTVASADNLPAVAQNLFTALRALDAAGVDVILARDFGSAGLGLAIRDRLTRAAAGHVVDVGDA